MKKPPSKITIQSDETAPKVLASAIVDLSKSAKQLLNGPLTKDCVCLLVSQSMRHTDRLAPRVVGQVLEAAANLGRDWVK